jgi:hypothetical protein
MMIPSRVRTLLSSVVLLGMLVSVSCTREAPSESSASANPLQGVWSLAVSDAGDGSPANDPSQPGLYIFADGYYSAVYAPGAELRMRSATTFQPTAEEMVAQHQSIIVNTGTYEIDGSTVTFRPIIAKSPGFVGGQARSEFRVEGDMLTLVSSSIVGAEGTSAPGGSERLTLRRVE